VADVNRPKLKLINEQLRAIDAVPLLSDEAADLFKDDELENAVRLSKKHLQLLHKLLSERYKDRL
jgi:hypothetical protein